MKCRNIVYNKGNIVILIQYVLPSFFKCWILLGCILLWGRSMKCRNIVYNKGNIVIRILHVLPSFFKCWILPLWHQYFCLEFFFCHVCKLVQNKFCFTSENRSFSHISKSYQYVLMKWASTGENLSSRVLNSKGADQPMHSRSLISTIVFRY